jgi:glyceraldehyde 3-phosphate dehydrogenase
MKRLAINGFGRIGRNFFKLALTEYAQTDIEIVAINDLGNIDNLAYLLTYDSVYNHIRPEVEVKRGEEENYLVVNGQEVQVFSEKDPQDLPWGELDIDVVIESTGVFTSHEASQAHIDAGAKRVVVSAPADNTSHVTLAINEDELDTSSISSNASCTTNATNPVVAVLDETIGIEKAMLSTVHGYTSSQSLIDQPSDKIRRGRAGGVNIIPSSTGAAKAVGRTMSKFEGIFDGVAVRVPVPSGSIIDVTFLAGRATDTQEVNDILREAASRERWQGVLTVTEDPLVSTDILGNQHASIVDTQMTRVVDDNLVKVMAWYDNEWGYVSMMMQHVLSVCERL